MHNEHWGSTLPEGITTQLHSYQMYRWDENKELSHFHQPFLVEINDELRYRYIGFQQQGQDGVVKPVTSYDPWLGMRSNARPSHLIFTGVCSLLHDFISDLNTFEFEARDVFFPLSPLLAVWRPLLSCRILRTSQEVWEMRLPQLLIFQAIRSVGCSEVLSCQRDWYISWAVFCSEGLSNLTYRTIIVLFRLSFQCKFLSLASWSDSYILVEINVFPSGKNQVTL